MDNYNEASLIITPNGKKSGKLFALKGDDLSVVRATEASYVNSDGVIKYALPNEVRFDYSNGGCPSILVEPQRTNLIAVSNGLSENFFNGVVVLNAVTSPQGINNAFSFDVNNGQQGGFSPITLTTSAQSYTFSVYLKGSVNGQKVRLFGDANGAIQDFTLTTEWARYTKTFTGAVAVQSIYLLNGSYFSPAQNDLYYGYGLQLEVGSYATSLIPTQVSSVTRNADVISKTGISSLIGQTEGTIFVDFNINNISSQANNPVLFSLFGNATIYLQIFTSGYGELIYSTGSGQLDYLYWPSITNGRHKLAMGYKTNDFVLYIDGLQIATGSSGYVDTLNSFYFGYNNATFNPTANYKTAALFKTRLSNSELAQLTTI